MSAAGTLSAAGGCDGLGRPVGPESRWHVYCAIKPLLATAIGVLVDQGELSLDDRVGHLVRCADWLAPRTVAAVLEHRAGLHQPGPMEAGLLGGEELRRQALHGPPLRPPLGSAESFYTECASWLVLGEVLRAAAGGAAMTGLVRDLVLRPLGLDGEFDLGDGDGDDGRLRVNVSLRRRDRAVPMLQEVSSMLRWADNPGFGGRATVAGLVGLAVETMAALRGEGRLLRPETAAALALGGSRTFDRVQQWWFTFAGGWMRDLSEQRFGHAVGPRAFGHPGWRGMTTVWADPDAGSAAGWHLNGLGDEATMLDWLRPALVAALTANLDPTGETDAVARPEPGR